MRRELTDVFIRSLPPPANGRVEIWDSRVSGLVLRITPTGAATWSVSLDFSYARGASGLRI